MPVNTKFGIRVRIDGDKELMAALKELPRATAKNALRRALVKAATPLRDRARQLSPKFLHFLERSINISKVKLQAKDAGKRAFAEAMKRGATREEAGVAAHEANAAVAADTTAGFIIIGPGRNPQATLQEFGTVHHAAKPYMRPTWDEGKHTAQAIIAAELKNEIEKSAARLARKQAKLTKT